MSQKSRQEMLEPARERYGRRGRQGRSRLLDEVCALCGYERKHALKVLGGSRGHCRPWWSARGIFAGLRRGPEHAVLKKIWLAAEQPCGSCVRQVLQKCMEVLVEVGVLVGSRTGCGA